MEMRRILAMIAALLLCLAVVTAGAEVTAKNTEKDGKLLFLSVIDSERAKKRETEA